MRLLVSPLFSYTPASELHQPQRWAAGAAGEQPQRCCWSLHTWQRACCAVEQLARLRQGAGVPSRIRLAVDGTNAPGRPQRLRRSTPTLSRLPRAVTRCRPRRQPARCHPPDGAARLRETGQLHGAKADLLCQQLVKPTCVQWKPSRARHCSGMPDVLLCGVAAGSNASWATKWRSRGAQRAPPWRRCCGGARGVCSVPMRCPSSGSPGQGHPAAPVAAGPTRVDTGLCAGGAAVQMRVGGRRLGTRRVWGCVPRCVPNPSTSPPPTTRPSTARYSCCGIGRHRRRLLCRTFSTW